MNEHNAAAAQILHLPVTAIQPPDGARAADAGLIQSVKTHGILQPIGVRPAAGGFLVVWGSRRLEAAKRAGLATVPAIVFPSLDAAKEKSITLAENLMRAAPSPVWEGEILLELLNLGETVEGLARQLGRKRSWVAQRLRLAALPERAKALLAVISYAPSAVARLAALPDAALVSVLESNPAAAASVDLAEDAVRAASRPIAEAAFDTSDCAKCPSVTNGLCHDVECYGEKARLHAGGIVAGEGVPVVVKRRDLDFGQPIDRRVYKTQHAAPVDDFRIVPPSDPAGRDVVVLGPGGAAERVRIVEKPRPIDGRAKRYAHPDSAERASAAKLAARVADALPDLAASVTAPRWDALAALVTGAPVADELAAFHAIAAALLPPVLAALRRPVYAVPAADRRDLCKRALAAFVADPDASLAALRNA